MVNDPVLSVVVAIVSDTTGNTNTAHLDPCLEALLRQEGAPAIEIIVPYHPATSGIDESRRRYPGVRFLEVSDLKRYNPEGGREHHNELRARGLTAARGRFLALIEDHGIAAPNWASSVMQAHAQRVAGVGGAIENRIDRALNWAVYFCDFGQYGNPLPAGDAALLSDANVSYKREALESIGDVWSHVFHEGAVNHALRLRGERLVLAPELVVSQNRISLPLGTALKERYIWGWSYGAGRKLTGVTRLIWAALAPALPLLIVTRIGLGAARKGQLAAFLKSAPLVGLMSATWCWGEMIAYLTGARIAEEALPDVPADPLPLHPRLSVVVVLTGVSIEPPEKAELTQTLMALERQGTGWPAEVIVPHDARLSGLAWLRARFPAVHFFAIDPVSEAGSSEILDELRARGVGAATGDIVAVIEDHVRPDTEWSRRIAEAHQSGYAAIGGAIENGIDRVMNWAAYFSDIGRYHNPLPEGESAFASVVNISYKRTCLEKIRAVWQDRFGETAVHWALTAQRKKLALSPHIIVWQHRENLRFGKSAREFFNWGRSYGSTRGKLVGPVKRLIYSAMAPAIPVVLLLRSARDVQAKRRLMGAWLKSLPLGIALTGAWCCGELTGYLAGEVKPKPKSTVRESRAAG